MNRDTLGMPVGKSELEWKYATPPQSPDISIRPAWKAEIFSSVQQAIRR